jgi:hypothetical protein
MSEITSPIVSHRRPFLPLAVRPRPRRWLDEAQRASRDGARPAEPDRVIGNEHVSRTLHPSQPRSIPLLKSRLRRLALLKSP